MNPIPSNERTRAIFPLRLRRAVGFRFQCFGVFSVCAAIIVLGAATTPARLPGGNDDSLGSWATRGLGTHGRIAKLAGMKTYNECVLWRHCKLPCPTCGMTTAVSLLMHGKPLCALVCQPFGFAVGVAALLVAAWSAFGVIDGRRPSFVRFADAVGIELLLVGIALFFVLSWIYKIVVVTAL